MSNPAMRYGLIFGAILALIGAANSVVSLATGAYANAGTGRRDVASTLLGVVLFVVGIVLYLLAGRGAAMQTGKVGTGAIAGMIAGIFATIVGAIITIAIVFAAPIPAIPANVTNVFTPDQFAALYRGAAIVVSVLSILLGAGIGAGLGALGGLMGKNTYEKANPPGMPGGYPSQPMR